MYAHPYAPIPPHHQIASSPHHTQDSHTIYLQGSESTIVPFPSFSKNISRVLVNTSPLIGSKDYPISVPIESRILHILREYIELLPIGARTIHGQPTHILENVYPITNVTYANNPYMTILVHSLVKENILRYITSQEYTQHETWNALLIRLYLAAFQLQIPSLMDCFASIIIDKIDINPDKIQQASRELQSPFHDINYLKNNYPRALQEITENPNYIRTFLQIRQSEIPLEALFLLQKYMQLRIFSVSEMTVADYIGLTGNPQIIEGTLDLQNKGLSSLDGLKLVLNKEAVTSLDLSKNQIIKHFIATDFLNPIPAEFRNISTLNLSTNLIKQIPPSFFIHLPNLSSLNLEDNQIIELSAGTFHGLHNMLDNLNLNNNFILRIDGTIFRELIWCKRLYLSNNLLTELPPNLFHYTDIESLHLEKNRLSTLPETLFSKPSQYINRIYLSGNHLSILPKDLLHPCRYLNILDLKNNQLRTLPSEFFRNLDLELVDVRHNYFSGDPEIFRLRHLSLMQSRTKLKFTPQKKYPLPGE